MDDYAISGSKSGENARIGYLTGVRKVRVMTLLFMVSMFNFIDRQILNILAEPIKVDLGLHDWQLGLLTGLAFALFYSLLGIPVARLAERWHRPRLLGLAVGVWSAFTVASGLAVNYVMLVLARMGVGVGESACTPTAHSLISDYVPRKSLATGISIFSLGVPAGSLLGLGLGGVVGDLYGWRNALLLVGLPGLFLAVATFFVLPEPRLDREPQAVPKFRTAIKLMVRKRSLRWILLASAFFGLGVYGPAAFIASFLLRAHVPGLSQMALQVEAVTGWQVGPQSVVGMILGIAIGLTGMVGTYLGGRIADRWSERNDRAFVDTPALFAAASIPLFLAVLFVSSFPIVCLLLIFHSLMIYGGLAPIYASALGVVSSDSRATASAFLMTVVTLVGLGAGPLLIGLISDLFNWSGSGSADGLRYGLTVVKGLTIFGVIGLVMARVTYLDEME